MRLDPDHLRLMTLARQFPAPAAVAGPSGVADLLGRVGPIQSQAPRAPFVGLAARRPGVSYSEIAAAFDSYELIKNPSLRRTVHTVARGSFSAVEAVAERTAAGPTSTFLRLNRVSFAELRAETESYCVDWRERGDLVDHIHAWLAEHDSAQIAARVESAAGANHVWAHAAVLRRPSDGRWERRTDTLHRAVRTLVGLPREPADAALRTLVTMHLAAFGPATRRDIAWWSGESLGRVDAAVAALGGALRPAAGADGQTYLDLAEPPAGAAGPEVGEGPAGVRLLPEFDALICAYAPGGRERFLAGAHRAAVAGLQHREYSPTVLADGRLTATWRLVAAVGRRHIEITPLPGTAPPRPADLEAAVADLGRALGTSVDGVTVR
jgi:hypothetical protein